MTCQNTTCDNEATVAIRTTRPGRSDLKTTIFWDDREAPKTAERMCGQCLATTVDELAKVLA